jgi:hypothetical protein
MNWTRRSRSIQAGDTVAYSGQFLQSIACHTGDMPRARGKVIALVPVGKEVTLAEIAWDLPDLPGRVNIKNLCQVQSIARGA